MTRLATNIQGLVEPLKRLHQQVRSAVVESCERASLEELSVVAREEDGDTIYAIDRVSEELLVELFEREIAAIAPLIFIAEGLPEGKITLPRGTSEDDAAWRIIVDPIDGTRGLMYQKRSAWILTGVALNKGPATSLSDIEFAIQTEIPLVKQHLSDCLWASKDQGVTAERFNRLTGDSQSIMLKPSRAKTIAHGYAQVSRFFPGARDVLAAIDEEVVLAALGPVQPGKTHCFEDQYASSAGQLYELMSGRDRFTADLRPLLNEVLAKRGATLGICCHPYDVCAELIAREAGVIVTDAYGQQLNAELSVKPDVSWIGYANQAIRSQIEPLLMSALKSRGLLSPNE